ncbi:MAG: molybdopterin-guanine dinucleotide biosynthesis protein B [Eggerthellaceae bacterium]|nr:molybdopterin-guanine dinucleotide biosynthesis protein B [Eggerthellaceae bacterium]
MSTTTFPSPAVAIVGRHNSGKTTLVVKLIAELTARGFDVGSVKHHSHPGFEIDIPGKDSYRHREAGATETVIAAPGQLAKVKTIPVGQDPECTDLVASMPGHDIVLVEGFRKSGLPSIEIMRAANEADAAVARTFAWGAREGLPLGTDFVQLGKAFAESLVDSEADPEAAALALHEMAKAPTGNTVAVITDIPEAEEASEVYGIPCFHPDDYLSVATFLEMNFVRPKVSLVIQAGGESRRMGESKATVIFDGRPLICRLIERLMPAADELIITTNEAPRLAFLQENYPGTRIRLVPDRFERRGALQGIATALSAAKNPFVAIVACDMVFASPRLVQAEAVLMNESLADVVVPVNKYGWEPFHALYRRDVCLDEVLRLLDEGKNRAQDLCSSESLNVYRMSTAEVRAAEPMCGCFINANTPDVLRSLESSLVD